MSTKIDLLKQIADKLGITDVEQLYYSTENDLLFAILQGINGIGKTVDYNDLKNQPVVNLIGTAENPVKLYDLQSGFYSISGFIKQDINGDSVLINHPMPFTVFQDDNIKFAFSGHLVKGYALHEDVWQTVLTDTLAFDSEIKAVRNDLLGFVKLKSIITQLVNSDIAFKNGRKLLFEKQDGTHSVGIFIGEYGTKLIDLKVGDTIKAGDVILFQNTNLPVIFEDDDNGYSIEFDGLVGFFIEVHNGDKSIRYHNPANPNVVVPIYENGEWLITELIFPTDSVVFATNLSNRPVVEGNWNFDSVKINPEEKLEIGSESEHINLNTKDYVSIDTPEGTKRFQFQETLSRSQFIALPKLASYTEYLIYEDEDENK